MASIKGKNTIPELLVRKELFKRGYRYRVNVVDMYGKPDIVLRKYKTVIFVNGCFWHMHAGCSRFHLPLSNQEYWESKITKNVDRDKRVYDYLTSKGWNCIVIWECELKKTKFIETMDRVTALINEWK